MNSAFLAFAFRDRDRALAAHVEKLLRSHDVVAKDGRILGGEAITPAVKALIEECEGLIALLTRREALASGGWTTHPWVIDELNYARDQGKPTLALVEQGVGIPGGPPIGGMYQDHQYLTYQEEVPLPTILDLSETISDWKKKAGRTLKVNLLPPDVANMIASDNAVQCTYRLFAGAKQTAWKQVEAVPQFNGEVHLYLSGILKQHDNIQLQIISPGKAWRAVLNPECVQVVLKPAT